MNTDTIYRVLEILGKTGIGSREMFRLKLAMKEHNCKILNDDKAQRDLEQMSWLSSERIKNSLNPNS